jgi:alpha-methylacyl-CoA racemase
MAASSERRAPHRLNPADTVTTVASSSGGVVVSGPLTGMTVIEVAGIGPGPFAAMMLSDMGAEVIKIDRAQHVSPAGARPPGPPVNVSDRGRRSLALNLKHPEGRATLLRLVERADALIEGFRPGVAERLGIGPDDCKAVNPKLVYGRMTGWGQDGPYAHAAGHDINYIALAGTLNAIGRSHDRPVPPLNLVGDFGGGGMFLAFGVVCALLEAARSGQGQVVDAAMVDGTAVLSTMFFAMRALGAWTSERGTNLLDTGAYFYEVYECADGRCVSIGAIEQQFYAELCRITGFETEVPADERADQNDRTSWPGRKEAMAALFKTRDRDEWCALLEYTDACFAPVLSWDEAPSHPHNAARGTFVEYEGVVQPAPAPRFSRTRPQIQRPPSHAGQHTDEVLAELGLDAGAVAELRSSGAVA